MKARNPIPTNARRGILAGVLSLVIFAAVGNIGHTYANADRAHQAIGYALALAVTPDIGVIVGVVLLKFRRRSTWGWAILATSVALVSWSAFTVAGESPHDRVIALAPVLFAVLGAGLLESVDGESLESVLAHADALVEDARRDAGRAHEAALETARQAHADVAQAAESARTATVRADALAAELAGARQAHEAEIEALRTAHEAAADRPAQAHGEGRTGKRTATARKAAQPPAQPDDLRRRREAEDAYKASVRSGRPLDPAAVARILCGVEDPDQAQKAKARARASEWRRAVETETRTEAAR